MKTRLTLFLAALAGWMNRKQQEVIDYLQTENEILKEQLKRKGRLVLSKNLSEPQLTFDSRKSGQLLQRNQVLSSEV